MIQSRRRRLDAKNTECGYVKNPETQSSCCITFLFYAHFDLYYNYITNLKNCQKDYIYILIHRGHIVPQQLR